MSCDTFHEVLRRWSCGLHDHWPESGDSQYFNQFPQRHPELPLSVTWQWLFSPSVSTPSSSSPTCAIVSQSPIASFEAFSAFSSSWKKCIKSSFPFLQSMLIRLSHILPPNIRQCMKNWPNPWPQFSSLLLTFSPATNYLRYVGRASVTLQYLNWLKKFILLRLINLPFCVVLETITNSSKVVTESVLQYQFCYLYWCLYWSCKLLLFSKFSGV